MSPEEKIYFPRRGTSTNTSPSHACSFSRGPTGMQRAPLLPHPQQHHHQEQQQQLSYNHQYHPMYNSSSSMGPRPSGGGSSPWEVLNSYPDMENNEIVRRAKKMVWQANDMYDFVRGRSWRVRTTQGRRRRRSFSAGVGPSKWIPFGGGREQNQLISGCDKGE